MPDDQALTSRRCITRLSANLALAWRMLARDWRAGELTVLGLAVLLAVAALTSVSFLADRVERALQVEAHQLLGGDLLLSADHPWPASFADEAAARGLRVARSVTFLSMLQHRGAAQLVEVKAVSADYPLRGALRIAPALNQPDDVTRQIPARGTAWPDERLATALTLTPGMPLALGQARLTMSALLTLEPDRGTNVFAIAPRLLIALDDLPATGLVQEGSRIAYRLHVAGELPAVAAFERWAKPRLGRGEKLETLDNARPEIRNLTERAQRFLRLAALLAVVLAAVATALAAERYLRRHLDACAVMRCLGASGAQILLIHGGEFLLFGLLATVAGCALGYAAQALLVQLLGGLLAGGLPAPSAWPWLQGLLVGLLLMAGFALPPLLRLRHVLPLRVLRREFAAAEAASFGAYLLGAALLAALMLWLAGGWRLGGLVLGGLLAALALFALATRGLVALLGLLRPNGAAYGWRHGLLNLRRRLRATLVQAVALALGLTALLLLVLARSDLLASWQKSLPPDAPNRFVINIQPDQRPAIADFFRQRGITPPDFAPMARGRLTAINGAPVEPADYADDQARRLVDREFNLSWTTSLPTDNRIVAGHWYGADPRPAFSVEQGIAETLRLKLGDVLRYEVAGQRIEAPITSLRKLDWDSMRVNFFVLAPPRLFAAAPVSYITSFYLPPQHAAAMPDLVRAFPNLTVIDTAAVLRQLDAMLGKITQAIGLVFAFTLLAGLVVLYAALQAGGDERQHELAVLRALGARQRQLRAALLGEFALLGAVAGLLAGIAASLIGWALATFVFHLDYLPALRWPLLGLLAGGGLVAAIGWLSAARLLRAPVMGMLRETVA